MFSKASGPVLLAIRGGSGISPAAAVTVLTTAISAALAWSWSDTRFDRSRESWDALASNATLSSLLISVGVISFIFSAFATLREGFASDETALLVLTPLKADLLLQIVFARVFIVAFRAELLVINLAIGIQLGSHGIWWILTAAALQVGTIAVGFLTTCILVVGMKSLANDLSAVLALILLLVSIVGMVSSWLLGSQFGLILSALILFCAAELAGQRLAGRVTHIYINAFQTIQGSSGGNRDLRPRWLTQIIARKAQSVGGVIGAGLFKEVLYQSRNRLNLVRIVIIGGLPFAYPWIRDWIDVGTVSELALIVGFSAVVGLYSLVDFSPSPIGSEGNRLALYLTAPISMRSFLWSKLIVYVATSTMLGVLVALGISVWRGERLANVLEVLVFVTLITIGATSALVLGSSSDENIDLPVEGRAQTLLHEHVPASVQRVWNINISLAILAVSFIVYWKCSTSLAFPLLIALDILIIWSGFRLAYRLLATQIDPP